MITEVAAVAGTIGGVTIIVAGDAARTASYQRSLAIGNGVGGEVKTSPLLLVEVESTWPRRHRRRTLR